MPKLYSARVAIKSFEKAGFVKISQKGSHLKMRGFWDGKLQTIIIPCTGKSDLVLFKAY